MRIDASTVVLLTGASSGIGLAAARRFARRGAKIALVGRDAAVLGRVADDCRLRGGTPLVVTIDLRDHTQISACVRRVLDEWGHVDVWVGCASVYGFGRFDAVPRDVFDATLDVNLRAPIEFARVLSPHMHDRGGVLIFVGSLYSEIAMPYVSPYVTSKHALLGFAESLRLETRSTRMSVSVILPSTIDTPIHQHAANVSGRRARPLPPVVAPERVADAIVRAARRPRRSVPVGRVQRIALVARRFLPGLYDVIAEPLMRRRGFSRESADATWGNIEHPAPPRGRIHGGWR